MIYPAAIIFHGILGTLGLVSFLYLFYFKKRGGGEAVRHYYTWFFFFFLNSVFLLLPLLIFKDLNPVTALFYNISRIFLGIAAWHGFRLALFLRVEHEPTRRVASFVYISAVAIVVLPHFIFPEIPMGSENGQWVFWHSRDIATYLHSALMLIAGWSFAYVNFEAFLKLTSPMLRARVMLYSIAGFLLPFSAYYYFGASSVKEIQISYILSVAGMTLFAIGNVIVGAIIKREN